MWRFFSKYVAIVFFTALVFFGCTAATRPTDNSIESPIEATISDYDQLRELVSESVQAAEAKGQDRVTIHLKEDPDMVQPADLVRADYTVTDPAGNIVYSTRDEDYQQIVPPYTALFGRAKTATGPEMILAGVSGLFPGSAQAVLGLRDNATETVTVQPEKAFGPSDPQKIKTYACQHSLPRTIRMPVDAYKKKFNATPEAGREVKLTPYFAYRIASVNAGIVVLEGKIPENPVIQDSFGTTRLSVEDDRVILVLEPAIGETFTADQRAGMITKSENGRFTVDYNPPLAGKTLIFDVAILDILKSSHFDPIHIQWREDHNAAMDQAQREQKPVVLVLYASWCKWSKHLLNTTFEDPRVKQYSNRFVWLKIDSDKERMYKEIFEQTSYPMIVLMDRNGEVVQKLQGFQDGGILALALQKLMAMESRSTEATISREIRGVPEKFIR